MSVSNSHHLDVVDGKFSGTTSVDLANLFKEVEKSQYRDHLVVHFHGGLVPRKSAERIADTLIPEYLSGGAYPIFFFWNSGALEVLTSNLDEIAKEPVFWRLLKRLALLLAGKFAQPTGTRGNKIYTESIKDVPDDSDTFLEWARKNEPLSSSNISDLSDGQIYQIENDLRNDQWLVEEARAIAIGLRKPQEIDRDLASVARGGPSVRASQKTLMSPTILKSIAEESTDISKRSASTILTIAKYGVKIARAVIARYQNGRDHGLPATISEEIARSLYADSIGSTAWTLMKADTKDAFGGDPQRHGGTAFITQLHKWWKPGRRITLVGHSAGAIYIGHLLEYADPVLEDAAKFEVVFLAPACTFEFMKQRLPLFTKRISDFRMFSLGDDLERGYWEVPALYPASLLYMISGLLEDPVIDMPIVGMQRYYDLTGPYNDLPEIPDVAEWIGNRHVWSVSTDQVGLQTAAKKHSQFAEDKYTLTSIKQILESGF